MPLMSALPAMPSPMPAPMAPPPRASPPPMRPPAVATAWVMSFAAMVSSSPSKTDVGQKPELVLLGGGEAEVEDGQERVDEGLDGRDEAGVENPPDEVGEAVEREQVERQKCDDGEHDATGED